MNHYYVLTSYNSHNLCACDSVSVRMVAVWSVAVCSVVEYGAWCMGAHAGDQAGANKSLLNTKRQKEDKSKRNAEERRAQPCRRGLRVSERNK